MNRPSVHKAAFTIDNGRGFDIRAARVGKGPLVELWVSEHGRRSCGIILNMADITKVINGLNDVADDIDADFPPADRKEVAA